MNDNLSTSIELKVDELDINMGNNGNIRLKGAVISVTSSTTEGAIKSFYEALKDLIPQPPTDRRIHE